jgi:hypothetical protein
MLAAMCDLIVAADDAVFQNPVARMSGMGVELLVEPWELGIRKAKEFLLTGDEIDAHEAWRLGMVNKVVPRAELLDAATAMAAKIALVPPVTAERIKDSVNQTFELMGKRNAWNFPAHPPPTHDRWASSTTRADGLDAGIRRAIAATPPSGADCDRWAARGCVLDVGLRASAPFCRPARRMGAESSGQEAGTGDFMREIGLRGPDPGTRSPAGDATDRLTVQATRCSGRWKGGA